jgi:hypothetical protein
LGWRKSGFPLALEKWSRISGVTLLHVPEGLVPAQDYADYIHLNARGRAAFSHWFAGWLKRSRILPFSASP